MVISWYDQIFLLTAYFVVDVNGPANIFLQIYKNKSLT